MEKFKDRYRIHSARAKWRNYDSNGIYFITICTSGHDHYFGHIINKQMVLSDIGLMVQKEWEKSFIIRKELKCDAYVIMPNHIHAILRIETHAETHGCASLQPNPPNPDASLLQTHGTTRSGNATYKEAPREGNASSRVETHGRASLQPYPDASLQPNPDAFLQPIPDASLQPNPDASLQPNPDASLQPNPDASLPPYLSAGQHAGKNYGSAYRPPRSVSSFMAGFKSIVTINAVKINPCFGWQTRFYDHIIRNDQDYQRIAEYIENNAANWEEDVLFGIDS